MKCPVCEQETKKSPRSLRRMRMLHGLVSMLFDGLPDDKRPPDKERLRYWMAVKIGSYDVKAVFPAESLEENMIAMFKQVMTGASKKYFFVPIDGGLIEIRKAKSISFGKMSEDDFANVLDRYIDLTVKMLPGVKKKHIRSHLMEITGLNTLEGGIW